MIRPQFFYDTLAKYGITFYAGVPDSLLKNLCAYITDHADDRHNIIAANEGGAMGLAAGHYLATGEVPVVYMQNSGEGNIINPLASLTDKDVYNIPVLLVIGWRGRPGIHDEPQHVKQGKVTLALLDTMGVPYTVLSKEETEAAMQISRAVERMTTTKEAYALVIEKDTFDGYTLQNVVDNDLSLAREEAIHTVAAALSKKDVIVSTTGMISRELFEYRVGKSEGHEHDFLTVGSMGHASQIALGIALEKTDRRVWCFDGDGASIMHMGSMAIVASKRATNYIHVVFNNGAHDSVGGQPTVGLGIDLPAIAKAMGYTAVHDVSTAEELNAALAEINNQSGPVLLQIRVKKGNRKDLGRPTTTPIQNKEALMAFLNSI
jgi:phosphonopyruvate decarboxylase